jgi:predicted nucleic acid-binding protein
MPGAEARGATAVLDASVAVRWVVEELGSEEAADLLARPIGWVAPRLMLTEVAAALRRKAEGGAIAGEAALQALGAIEEAVDDGTIRLTDDEEFISAALGLALTLGHRVPDCLYLAVAEREGCTLATADRRLELLAQQRGVPTHLVPSAGP